MPEVGDHYLGAEILLLRGDEMAMDNEVTWSHDANGNVMSRVIRIQSLILGCIKLSLLEVMLQNEPPIPLLRKRTPSAMQTGMSIFSYRC